MLNCFSVFTWETVRRLCCLGALGVIPGSARTVPYVKTYLKTLLQIILLVLKYYVIQIRTKWFDIITKTCSPIALENDTAIICRPTAVPIIVSLSY